jgi:hypothetical protein
VSSRARKNNKKSTVGTKKRAPVKEEVLAKEGSRCRLLELPPGQSIHLPQGMNNYSNPMQSYGTASMTFSKSENSNLGIHRPSSQRSIPPRKDTPSSAAENSSHSRKHANSFDLSSVHYGCATPPFGSPTFTSAPSSPLSILSWTNTRMLLGC